MSENDPIPVAAVDLNRYVGLWYEIGRYPNFFQKFCERSTAQYTLEFDRKISVLNTCYRKNKIFSTIKGKASISDPTEPAKLVVDFGFFRKGDYWIIGLDNDYQWAIVSGPKKSYLFILARQAPMDFFLLKQILKNLEEQGFDTSKIIFDIY